MSVIARRGHGFTLIELLVVIAIIAILAAILFPVFAKAREKARQSACTNNQRQIAVAAQMWTQDHDEMFPESSEFWGAIAMAKGSLKCPSKAKMANGYVFNHTLSGLALGEITDTAGMFLCTDGEHTVTAAQPGYGPTYPNIAYEALDLKERHNKRLLASFVDGHVALTLAAGIAGGLSGLPSDGTPIPITVQNASFEDPVCDGSLGTWGDFSGTTWGRPITGWTVTNNVTMMRNTVTNLALPCDGRQYGFMQYGATPQTCSISQTLTEQSLANSAYELTAAVQIPTPNAPTWDVQLVIGSTTYRVPAADMATVGVNGTTFTNVTVKTPKLTAGGESIKILITSTGSSDWGSGGYMFSFDNVRLVRYLQ